MIANENPPDEACFIRVYVNLMGATESQARGVFMYACDQRDQFERTVNSGIAGFEVLMPETRERSWQTPASIPVLIQPAAA